MKELINCLLVGVSHKEKYPEAVRNFCLMIHTLSVRAYEAIRSYFGNNLPHSGTIRSWRANADLNCDVGINEACLNILKRKAEEKRASGSELIVSVIFDEMHIRRMFQWCNSSRKILGFPTIGVHENSNVEAANQVIVFMVCGINERIQLPLAYHFILKLKAEERKTLLLSIIESLVNVNIKVANIAFDGLSSNKRMCTLLGACLNIFSDKFKPYFEVSNGDKVRIIFDICHMEKLVRGTIGTKEVIFDSADNKIEWKYFENLVNYSKKGFGFTHKLTKDHIEWKQNKMKVDLAVQILSESTATSIEYLMKNGYKEFADATWTIDFVRMFNHLFDVFNSKTLQHENPMKRSLNPNNKEEIFKLFETAIEKIKGYKILNKTGEKIVRLVKSGLQTGFKGFIINMYSLMSLYEEYVEEKKLLASIPTYHLNQDPVEILFGKVRSLNGCNDNPSCQQFHGAYRKLLVFNTICTSRKASCYNYDVATEPFSDILFISSRRATCKTYDDDKIPMPEELDEIHAKMIQIDIQEKCSLLDPNLHESSISYVSNIIEFRISRPDRMYCDSCANVFKQNIKLNSAYSSSKLKNSPCLSTYILCKNADRYLKLQLLKGDIDFSVIYYAILQEIDVEALFDQTDFTHEPDHKISLIRGIIDSYIQIKGTHIAKTATFELHEERIRNKLNKLIHVYGQ